MCTGRVGPRRNQTLKMIWEWIVHARFEEHLKWSMSKDNDEEEKGGEATLDGSLCPHCRSVEPSFEQDQSLIRIGSNISLNAQTCNLPSEALGPSQVAPNLADHSLQPAEAGIPLSPLRQIQQVWAELILE